MKTWSLFIIGCLLAAGVNAQAYAQNGQGGRGDDARIQIQNGFLQDEEQDEQTAIGRREASDLARRHYPGRVLSVRLDGRHWRVRMDEEGTVFNVFVDADNGQVIRPSE
jgi:uncharacterized membrane protein YkoI